MKKRHENLSIKEQCKLLGISNNAVYYRKKAENLENVKAMRALDSFYLDHPTAGARTMQQHLADLGMSFNLKRVRRLKRIDVYSRRIMSWKLSNTLDASESVEVLHDAVARFGHPEIINSDQGSQYTSGLWTEACGNEIKVSMDGRGRAKDNIWIERFWRTIKREYIYLNPCDNAGITLDKLALRMSESDFVEVINANLKSAFFGCREGLKVMSKKRFGAVVNIASIVGEIGNAGQAR